MLEERDGAGALCASYVYGLELLSQSQAGVVGYTLADGHSGVRLLVGVDGAAQATYRYDAYGVLVDSTGSAVNPHLYRDEWFEAVVGQYDLRARYYDPATGRFTVADSFFGHPTIPQTFHKYVYTGGDPLNRTDSSGHDFISALGVLAINLQFRAEEIGAKLTPAVYLATQISFYAFVSSTIILILEQAIIGGTDPYKRGVQEASFNALVILLFVSEFLPPSSRPSSPGGMASSSNSYPDEILDFAQRHGNSLSAAIGNRMRQVGVPENMIGMRGVPGVDEGPLVRYFRAQAGGNVRPPQYGVQQAGINVDYAVLDPRFPAMATRSRTWATASLKDRVDAVVAHEYTEVTAPTGPGQAAHDYVRPDSAS